MSSEEDKRRKKLEYLRGWRERNPGYWEEWRKKNPGYRKEWRKKNPTKARKQTREAYRTWSKKEGNKEKKRVAKMLRVYGLTQDGFMLLVSSQGGRCAICDGVFESRRDTHIDHDHKTGKLRAILCAFCNRGLGSFRDDPVRLIKAARYLRTHTGVASTKCLAPA